MIGNAPQCGTGLGQRQKFYNLPDSIWHGLRRKKGVTKVGHRHDYIIGEARHIRVAFGIERDHNSDGGEDGSVQKHQKERPAVKAQSGSDGKHQENDDDARIQSPETSSDDLACDKLPQRGRRDHDLVKCFFIKTLYIQVLGNGVKTSVHGGQGDHTGNQEV